MAELPKRELGSTGLQVTMLGYGAMELRGAPRGRDVTDTQAETILHAVLDAGTSRTTSRDSPELCQAASVSSRGMGRRQQLADVSS